MVELGMIIVYLINFIKQHGNVDETIESYFMK